ncbi:MAG: hypothetical protein ABJK59_11880 [Erythrobacter sp.]|uniref:hypothetical protein n=1 Tax=Erythrobacter sp. TaxID=1042 RepID=UPI003299A0A0
MQKPTLFLLLMSMMLLSGCVTIAKSPDGAVFGEDFSELTFEMGVTDSVSLGSATTQEYRIGDVAQYSDGVVTKIFTWASKSPKTLLVKAGERTAVFAQMDKKYGAPGFSPTTNNYCTNGSRFTPQPNTRYRIIQTGDAAVGCVLKVTDSETDRVPDDLEKVLFE